MMVVTTDSLPGYEVRHVIGQVIVSVPRTRNPFSEGVKTLRGNFLHPRASDHLQRWRVSALTKLGASAELMGANAVLAMRFEHREVGLMWMEMCAYGTAVVVARLPHDSGPVDRWEREGRGPDVDDDEEDTAPIEGLPVREG
ncbi:MULTISPECIES: heavy metal-binding domain-containing protein [Polymorphospora]|uniref:Heavy metal-binding domain-containing protein n=1 Tax=Polymorphospora lycopeni TaxID=3140240 RepID=A0ABV5CI79_9ACTN